jgi:hypothetical protein
MAITLVSTVTVGSGGAGGVDFLSIPQDYKDLLLVVSGRSASGGLSTADLLIRINDNTSSYSERFLLGSGSAASSGSFTGNGDLILKGMCAGSSSTANTFGNASIYISNYTAAANKSFSSDGVSENNATAAGQAIQASVWANTAAITKIRLGVFEGLGVNFVQNTTASLYGIS